MAKTALVSGGTSGVGRGVVFQLLQDGMNVAAFAPDIKKCEELTQALIATYGEDRFLVTPGDVTEERGIKNITTKTIEKFGAIDVLVNNATAGFSVSTEKVSKEEWEKILEANVAGMDTLIKHATPDMKKRKSGLIINISPAAGCTSAKAEPRVTTNYGATEYSGELRAELKEFGIRVATVCSGMVKTSFFTPEEVGRRKSEILGGGKEPPMLSVSDVVRVVSFICKQSEHSDIRDVFVMPF